MIEYQPVTSDFALAGKTAIVTGGAAGIGLATAQFLAAKGATLLIADLSDSADEVAKALGPANIGLSGDVTSSEYRDELFDIAEGQLGGADILVNSAGIVALDQAENLSDDMWNKTIAVNLTGSFFMSQAMGKHLIDSGRPGCIVNLASQAGVIALERHVAYCASKGGIIAMTKVLALEWGRYGIRVNCVSPTVVLTELGHQAWDGPVGEAFKKEIPAGRFAEPDEVAAIVGFLCSANAAMITGHNLLVDGGYVIK